MHIAFLLAHLSFAIYQSNPCYRFYMLVNPHIRIFQSFIVVSFHFDSKTGIPHLHIVANRIDNMGNTNDTQ